jgi:hypothetical protein
VPARFFLAMFLGRDRRATRLIQGIEIFLTICRHDMKLRPANCPHAHHNRYAGDIGTNKNIISGKWSQPRGEAQAE